jgi:hypothetical protein
MIARLVTRTAHRRLALLLTLGLAVVQPVPAWAYLKFGYEANGTQHTLKWAATPIQYFVSDTGVPGVSASQFQEAVGKAFDTWAAVPTASVTYQFAGFTRSLPGEDDGRSTLGFKDEPDMDRVLASTSYVVDVETGELLESDIFFNSAFAWSVAAKGESDKWDLQSIALHEIGHFNGLGHSALGETELIPGGGRHVLSSAAVMFPIALGPGDISGRVLDADDIAGISDLYPDNGFNETTGSLSGRITKGGAGVFGAHVVAIDPYSGKMVANFSLSTDGRFSIAGLRPGVHILRVEPLDDADTESFFDVSEPTDIDFKARYYERLVVVPRGGDSGTVVVKVVAK